MEFWIILGLVVAVPYGLYVKAIRIKNQAFEAAASIEVQLQKRFDLIPNVLTLAKKFMEHEKELLSSLTELRGQVTERSRALETEVELGRKAGGILGQFFAVAENYPELKSSATIVRAQETYEEVEGHVAAARRFYNAAVTDLNNALETFPMSFFAKMVGAQKMPYFDADPKASTAVSAADYL